MSKPTSIPQQVCSDGSLFITRIEVPGGWIYNSYDKSHKILGSCFVPIPNSLAVKCVNMHEELLHKLKGLIAKIESVAPEESSQPWPGFDDDLISARKLIAKAEGGEE